MIGRRTRRQLWSPTLSASSWSESTLAEKAWVVERGATLRWAVAGAIVGILLSLLLFAPAAWVAQAVASATDDRLLLADAQGTVWSGSAVVVLTGGAGSRDARYLPGRAEWTLSPRFYGAELVAREACCIGAPVVMQLRPGFGRMRVTIVPPRGPLGEWPSAWLSGYGTPLNTLQLGGTLRLISPGFTVESVQGRWRLEGRVDMELDGVSSRLTTLDTLGSYRLTLSGGSADSGVALLSVSTDAGPLQITGSGTLGPGGVKFRGEARAAATDEAALSNLLNIIGRRDGARSVISIG